jgi:predicted nucleic acid-binding protein
VIVVDTMILAYSVLETRWTEECRRLRAAENRWIAPTYAEVELMNVMWLHMRRGDFPPHAALLLYRTARTFLKSLQSVEEGEAFRIAADDDCSVYDARFVALARQRGVPLITYDRRLLDTFRDAVTPPQFLEAAGAVS